MIDLTNTALNVLEKKYRDMVQQKLAENPEVELILFVGEIHAEDFMELPDGVNADAFVAFDMDSRFLNDEHGIRFQMGWLMLEYIVGLDKLMPVGIFTTIFDILGYGARAPILSDVNTMLVGTQAFYDQITQAAEQYEKITHFDGFKYFDGFENFFNTEPGNGLEH